MSEACASLLCDNCPKPGNCCSGFTLNRHEWNYLTDLEVLAELASIRNCGTRLIGLPFSPIERRPSGERRYTCHMLGADGRCTDYDNRPDLCRDYKAGSDPLCIMHKPEITHSEELEQAA